MLNDHERMNAIVLSHGQARWVLWNSFRASLGEPSASFDAYLKMIRRHGLPFNDDERAGQPGVNAVYRFVHVMELAIALMLRRHLKPAEMPHVLGRYRDDLRPLYEAAWLERKSGRGKPIAVTVDGRKKVTLSGLWLDIDTYVDDDSALGRSFVGPQRGLKLLGPADYLRFISVPHYNLSRVPPLRIDDVAERIMDLAAQAPEIRRGPK